MDKKAFPYSNIDEYIAQCPAETQPMLDQLRRAIREAAPEAVEKISWDMPTFALHGNLVHFALAKKHIGFFPGKSAVEAFRARLEGYQLAAGTVRLPLDKLLPLDLIREMVAFCAAENLREAEIKRAEANSALESLPNMGKVLAGNLRAIGIETPDQLRALGAKEALVRIRAAADPGACVQMLYGLQGAVEGIRDTLLAPETKEDLRAFFRKL